MPVAVSTPFDMEAGDPAPGARESEGIDQCNDCINETIHIY